MNSEINVGSSLVLNNWFVRPFSLLMKCNWICLRGLFFHGSTARYGPGPPHCRGFTIALSHTHNNTVGLLWTSDQPVAQTSTWQHAAFTTDRHPCPGEIWTHNPSKRAAAEPRHRPRRHWDATRTYCSVSFVIPYMLDRNLVPSCCAACHARTTS
jgi:hypothetical protein